MPSATSASPCALICETDARHWEGALCLEIAERLSERRLVSLFQPELWLPEPRRQPQLLPQRLPSWPWLSDRWQARLRERWLAARLPDLRGWLRTGKVDSTLERLHGFNTAWVGANVISITRLAEPSSTPADLTASQRESRIYRPQPGLRSARLLPVSSLLERQLRQRHAPGTTAIQVVPPGIDAQLWKPASAEQRQMLRRRLGLPNGAWVLGCAAPDAPASWDSLLAAVARLRPGAHVLVASDEIRRLQQHLEGAGPLARQVHGLPAHGASASEGRLWAACDAFWVVPRGEPVQIAALQAAATALPLLADGVAEVDDLLVPGHTGAIGDWSSHAEHWRAQPELARQLGQAARERIQALFDWPVVLDQLERQYELAVEPPIKQISDAGPTRYSTDPLQAQPALSV